MFQRKEVDHLPMVKPYLISVQHHNIEAVNEAFNELLIEEEDHATLRDSINSYDNFSQIELAMRLEKHDLLEFRRIAALLYKKNSRWDQSISLSKQDKLFKDATETAADSHEFEVAEDLLKYFVDIGAKELFAACLYVCFDLLRADVVAELSWRNGLNDYYQPYALQVMREQATKLASMEALVKSLSTKSAAKEQADENQPIIGPGGFNGPLMITNGGMAPLPQMNGMPGMVYQPTGFASGIY